ncbi:MAG: endonuclease/exonuclease/phosphatase family protein [Janthinobacterium lividum]
MTVLFFAATVLPLLPTEWWAARLLDFPRAYWAAALALAACGLLLSRHHAPRRIAAMLGLALVGIGINLAILWPYRPAATRLASSTAGACPTPQQFSVLIANVRLGNRNAAPLLEAVGRTAPDVFLAMETDAWWDQALRPVTASMPHTVQEITGSYYGIELFSRLPLRSGAIRYLAGADTPAVLAEVVLRTGEAVSFVGLHPRPPLVLQSALGRDSQLYAAAALLRERGEPSVLAGDLNATPWEIAVQRLRRLAGLVDPRRDTGYVATWNARSAWFRWPLDHILHEGGFTTVSIERLGAFGSDHFPYLARLCRTAGPPKPVPPAGPEDRAAANAVLTAAGASERLR